MNISKPIYAELKATLKAFSDTPVLVVGDIILDRYIWGEVDRVSAEAPVPILEIKSTEDRLGGAANSAKNLANLGAKVTLVGFTGVDSEAESLNSLCVTGGILTDGFVIDKERPTTFKTRVIGRTQQLVRIDREERGIGDASLREKLQKKIRNKIQESRCVILSDYAKGVVANDITTMLTEYANEKQISLEKRPLMVDPHPANYSLYSGITVAKPNRREAENVSGIKITDIESAYLAGRALLKKWRSDLIVVSLGEKGLAIVGKGAEEGIYLPTYAREVFDVSGAGDTVTAIFSLSLAVGASPLVAGTLANLGAGVVVSEVGTVPITMKQLEDEVERLCKA